MKRFWATVEYLPEQNAAIVDLTDEAGDWFGTGRVEIRSNDRTALYEEAYRHASLTAQSKGGYLARFIVEGRR